MKVQSASSQANEPTHAPAAASGGPGAAQVAVPAVFDMSGHRPSDVDIRAGNPVRGEPGSPVNGGAAALRLRGGGKGIPWGEPSTSSGASGSNNSARQALQMRRSQLDNQRQQLESELYNASREMPLMPTVERTSSSGMRTIEIGTAYGPMGNPQQQAAVAARMSALTRQINDVKRQIADVDRELS
ncbi:hypothetical protein [Paraburkholderia sp. BCC1876]|uniref:hypothetical protein n=1 Tax=Paraburkholderia sp. BCC1876 TaxID=2676303 RepID=UPI00158FAF7C|nr:hypothetical protein [Paraburkholderia sp. BCC1876]